MALAATSNSLRALNFTDNGYSVRSSRALNCNPLNSASTSGAYCVAAEFSGTPNCESGTFGRDGFAQRMWPVLLEGRHRRCNVRLNAGSSQESQTADTEIEKSSSSQGPSGQSHIDLLRQMTSESTMGTAAGSRKTIAQQLSEDRASGEEDEEITVALGSGKLDLMATDLTVSQKRNIRRQAYMDKVAKRNDAPFFTAVALFVLVPPVAILGVAVATGYVDLFP